jgi:hypothetical protein
LTFEDMTRVKATIPITKGQFSTRFKWFTPQTIVSANIPRTPSGFLLKHVASRLKQTSIETSSIYFKYQLPRNSRIEPKFFKTINKLSPNFLVIYRLFFLACFQTSKIDNFVVFIYRETLFFSTVV